jgi:hypothetical protein
MNDARVDKKSKKGSRLVRSIQGIGPRQKYDVRLEFPQFPQANLASDRAIKLGKFQRDTNSIQPPNIDLAFDGFEVVVAGDKIGVPAEIRRPVPLSD